MDCPHRDKLTIISTRRELGRLLVRCLIRSAALIFLFARLLTTELMGNRFMSMNSMHRFHTVSIHCALRPGHPFVCTVTSMRVDAMHYIPAKSSITQHHVE